MARLNNVNELNQFLFYANNKARAEFHVPFSMFRLNRSGQLALNPAFIKMVGFRMERSLTHMVLKAAGKAVGVAIDDVTVFASALANATQNDKQAQLEANETLAQSMRVALRQGYQSSVESQKRVQSYRIGQRYSGGALLRAISSPDMAVATEDGINYVNQDRLNLEARHWARLNFGVSPAPQRPAFQGKLTLFGQQIGTVGFRAQPRPPMLLPRGFWSRGAFFPLGRNVLYPTAGITGRRFLDAGLRALTQDFPTVYSALLNKWVDEASDSSSGAGGTAIRVRAVLNRRRLELDEG